ncbi:MAG: hypothetical protein DWP98_01255 [Bacteroidetes bacterium]|nr:MAG: hypothetical protein DWP98_01255 [Bacteroidota bacterium]MBL1144406.1 hypothetical protein [Bacteroidota bacterium]
MRALLFVIIISLTPLYFSCELETNNQEFTFHDLNIKFLKEDNFRIMVSNLNTDSILIQLNLSDCKI